MGSGHFDTQRYYQAAVNYKTQDKAELFQSKVYSAFDPIGIKFRESCASVEHPNPTSIIIACDVTGSMGKIPENLLKGGLGSVMESLLKIPAISNPQVMFAAVGDTDYDKAPLQVTQFESDNRIESQLKQLYLEGGGGGNIAESYHIIWYFAAFKTQLDTWKQGKKGLLFTMGDELVPTSLKAAHIKKFIDADYRGGDITTDQLLKAVSEKYDVFHLIVQDTATYGRLKAQVDKCWKEYLGERAILVPTHTEIPEKIISTVSSLCELNGLNNQWLPVQPEKTESIKTSPRLSNAKGVKQPSGIFHAPPPQTPSDSTGALSHDAVDKIPRLFICPISHEVMKDPVIAEDGYTYERDNITLWFQKKATSPMTNLVINQHLIPNHSLKSEIAEWQTKQAAQSANKVHNLT